MPILDLRALWSEPSINDEGVWQTYGSGPFYATGSGNVISDELAMRLSGVYACQKLIKESIAQLPLILYDRISGPDGQDTKRRSDDRLAYRLHDLPNDEMDQFEFVEQMTCYALFRQNAYAEKVYSGGDVQIYPRHPDRIRRERIKATGRLRYAYYEDDGSWRPILAEDMFRLSGTAVLDHARESFGIARAVQQYGAGSWRKGIHPQGFIATDPAVEHTDLGRAAIREAIEKEHAGAANAGGFILLPEGMKWNAMGMTNEQAEFVAYSTFTIIDCARYFGVPPYRVGVTEDAAMARASIEAQGIELVIFTFMPWVKRWEQAIGRDLIGDGRRFAEMLLAGLVRGTLAERYAAYAVARQWGWLSINDIRRLENMDPVAGGDTYLTPLNMIPIGQDRQQLEQGSPAAGLLRLLVDDAAGNILRRETSALAKVVRDTGAEGSAWEAAVAEFYKGHTTYVRKKLHLPEEAASAYVATQQAELLADGPDALSRWLGNGKADDLAILALGGV